MEQGSPTEPQDEADQEEQDEDVDNDDDDNDNGEDDDGEDASREETEEEAPQGPDRGRHASIRSGKKIRIFGDSRLVLQQVEGKWACAPQLWPYCAAAQVRVKWLEDQGHEVELLHVLRRFNKEADALANAGMDRPSEDAADFKIHISCCKGRLGIVRLLLDHGCFDNASTASRPRSGVLTCVWLLC